MQNIQGTFVFHSLLFILFYEYLGSFFVDSTVLPVLSSKLNFVHLFSVHNFFSNNFSFYIIFFLLSIKAAGTHSAFMAFSFLRVADFAKSGLVSLQYSPPLTILPILVVWQGILL